MNKKQFEKYLWIEKYRPATINETLLPTGMKSFFSNIVNGKEVPNLLFYSSSPGVGKTTIAKAICNEMNIDYLYTNTSSETGIDMLRTKIQKFASVKSLVGGNKVAIMDEFDGASPNLQNGLRAAMEEFHNSCRFIFTANFITKIIEPLKSRCQVFDFNMSDIKIQKEMIPKIINRLCGILDFEKVEYTKEIIKKLVDTFYPDIRKMIGLLQQYSTMTGGVIDTNILNYQQVDEEFFTFLINKELTKARKYLMDRNYNYSELYRQLFDYFVPKLDKSKQSQSILIIAEYMKYDSFVIDKEINAVACLLELIGI